MRQFYKEVQSSIPLDQGVIFSGAVASGVPQNLEVYGLIITPRCDISNGKIGFVHYLPVLPISLWKRYIYSEIYQLKERRKLEKKFDEFCEKNKISHSLFEPNFNFDDETIKNAVGPTKRLNEILAAFKEYKALGDLGYCASKLTGNKDLKSAVSDMHRNEHSQYYLIEKWDNPEEYMVVLLRDIKRISFSFAKGLEKGKKEMVVDSDIFQLNDISCTGEQMTNTYKNLVEIGSPYIEHLVETFSRNFCRIGIDRIDEKCVEQICNE